LADLGSRLAQAEAVLGRVELPGAMGSEAMTPSHEATRIHPPQRGSIDDR
jgi:hypothetical protein